MGSVGNSFFADGEFGKVLPAVRQVNPRVPVSYTTGLVIAVLNRFGSLVLKRTELTALVAACARNHLSQNEQIR